jgi:hypothetical protein
MRLYKSSKGQWVGTQRDAQRYFPKDPEMIDPEAYSWVSWAYETLRRGDKAEALKMLEKGLNKQKELMNDTQ